MKRLPIFLLAGSLLCFAFSNASGRILENWPYDKLFQKADLVVIGTAFSTEKSTDSFQDERWDLPCVGFNTAFQVKHRIKGPKTEKTIKVLQFRFGTPKKTKINPDPIINGPLFVKFKLVKKENLKFPMGPEYLLFLRKLKDGRYEPVSGKIDPQLSVRELTTPEEPE